MIKPYTDTPEQASQIARSAIPFASKLGLPVNPHIYAVCYQYTTKHNKELCGAFDELLKRQPIPDKLLVELLYQKHIIEDETKAVELLHSAVELLMTSAKNTLQSAESSAQNYGDSLDEAVTSLDQFVDSPSMLKGIVSKLLLDTTQMQLTTQALQVELVEAKLEASQLKQEYSRIREVSLTDSLTGIKNRRAFDEAFEHIFNSCRLEGKALSLLLIDIDYFKRVNDSFGHMVGDAVLKCLAKILKNTVRGNDICARFGGEEFTVLLPDTLAAGALLVAEKIRKIVAAQNLRHGDKDLNQVTVSIGVAQMNPIEEMDNFFERADSALYKAKDCGRNQVCCF